jgi:RNA polymerase subunit RPABC4/transcription elongation factor Spt4
VPIYICKNCGNLTESEAKDLLFCSTCGAPLGDPKPEPTAQPRPITTEAVQPSPRPIHTQQTRPPLSAPPEPSEEVEPPETMETPQTSESPRERTPPQQTAIPLDTPEVTRRLQTMSPESSPPGSSSEAQPQSSEDTPPIMEVFEDNNLVACPQCSYACDPNWTQCPICGVEIAGASDLQKVSEVTIEFDEESLKGKLIPCPKCQYACDPSWGTDKCPICGADLTQPPSNSSESQNPPD